MKKRFKRILTLICVLALTLGISGVVNAKTYNKSGGVGVDWRIEGDTLIFSGNGKINHGYPDDMTLMPDYNRDIASNPNTRIIKKIRIESGVTHIMGMGCLGMLLFLEEVAIPKTVVHIAPDSFIMDGKIKRINYEGTEEEWNNIKKFDNWNRITINGVCSRSNISGLYKAYGVTVPESEIPDEISSSKIFFNQPINVPTNPDQPQEQKPTVPDQPQEQKPTVLTKPDLTPSPSFSTKVGLSTDSALIPEGKPATVTLPKNTKATVKVKGSKTAKVKYNKKTGQIIITGGEAGTTEVTVKVGSGKNARTEKIQVKVVGAKLPDLPTTVTVKYGKNANLNTLKKKNNLKVTSSDNKVVTAKYNKSKGQITLQGKKKGKAEVKVIYGSETKKFTVNVDATTTKFSIKQKVKVKPGKSTNVKITATPKKSITGESASITRNTAPSVVRAEYLPSKNSIKLTGLTAGSADVSVKLGKITKTIRVDVK